MASLIMKIIACPIGVLIAAWLFPNVDYGAYYQAIIVGLILAVVGVLMEYLLLKRGTLWTSTLMDFIASVIIVYFVSNMFAGASVTFWGAVLTGLLLAVIEYFTHLWLIRSGRTQKSPA
ncbi:Protein of uncharacterised function (DUF2512) [Chlamydia abortus]|uniref:Phage holin family protein n=1 Tax=Paenibacillus residui TaxID=629724 RepID=A0ABW3DA47_9BACL|nr:phage holin family protein [Paenibacillus sp. 32O-W]SHE14229.1 Protein of uncharacterised function (DUF2512) [Chlamydia abortus]